MKRFGFLILILLVQLGFSQESAFSLLGTIPIETKFIVTDKLQQIYAVTYHNTVIKFTPDNENRNHYKEQYRFSNNTLGELSYVDATDPFNLILYYPDYQEVVTLDRTLTKIGALSLLNANVIQANTIALSNDGNVWIYDEAAFLLKKLDKNGNVLVESQNLSLLLSKAPKPIQLIARENAVYLNDPTLGIFVFNNFGQYVKLIPILDIVHFQILDNRLIYKQGKTLHLYNFQSFQSNNLPLPGEVSAEDPVQVQQGRLFVRKKEGINIYKMVP